MSGTTYDLYIDNFGVFETDPYIFVGESGLYRKCMVIMSNITNTDIDFSSFSNEELIAYAKQNPLSIEDENYRRIDDHRSGALFLETENEILRATICLLEWLREQQRNANVEEEVE